MHEPNIPYDKVWLSGRPVVREAIEWMILCGAPECPVQTMVNMCDRRRLTVKERNLVIFGTDYPWAGGPLSDQGLSKRLALLPDDTAMA